MKKNLFTLTAIVCLLSIENAKSQRRNEGGACRTPNGDSGLCINLNTCPILLNLLNLLTKSDDQSVRNYLRASACGFSGRDPLVCCPRKTTNPKSPVTEDPQPPQPQVTSTTTPRPQNNNNNGRFTLPSPPNCGKSNDTTPRIVNGTPAKLGEFPWMVALGYRNSKNVNQPKWLCGGSLITPKHVLTAAHCVHNRPDLYLARIGDLDLYSDDDGASPQTIELSKAKIHENYNPASVTNDIAILTMSRNAELRQYVGVVCLPVNDGSNIVPNNFVNLYPFVAGWGSTEFRGPSSPTLLKTLIPIVENNKCQQAFASARSVIDDRVLCAGYSNGGKDACQGDSGGPLMWGRSKGSNGVTTFYQIGVVSYGFKCAEPGYPGVYTKVQNFIDWIEKSINE